MKQLLVSQLEENMILAETVFSASGKPLIAEGTRLTNSLIQKLEEMRVARVAINDEGTINIDPKEVLLNRVHTQALQTLAAFIPVDVCGERLGETKERYERVIGVLEKVVRNEQVAALYLDLRTADDDTLDHSISVCVLSLIVGATLKLPVERLLTLGMAAMVHDIGKKSLPQEILAKREDFTTSELKLLQEHTKLGFLRLREVGLDVAIAKVALYHHERWDGSGYINKLAGEKIDLLSRIIAIADTYDDLTRGLTYKQKYLPHEAMELLYGTGNIYFDVRVVKAFTGSIAAYPLGTLVKLSSGEIGIVVNVHKTSAPRPIVKIYFDKNNNHLDYARQIDLSEEKTVFITKIL